MKPVILEQYFEGEESWRKFSSLFGEDWSSTDLQQMLLNKLNNKIDLAKVVYYHRGEGSLKWITQKIPALDGLTPIECLRNENTIHRLKECLMRMH